MKLIITEKCMVLLFFTCILVAPTHAIFLFPRMEFDDTYKTSITAHEKIAFDNYIFENDYIYNEDEKKILLEDRNLTINMLKTEKKFEINIKVKRLSVSYGSNEFFARSKSFQLIFKTDENFTEIKTLYLTLTFDLKSDKTVLTYNDKLRELNLKKIDGFFALADIYIEKDVIMIESGNIKAYWNNKSEWEFHFGKEVVFTLKPYNNALNLQVKNIGLSIIWEN